MKDLQAVSATAAPRGTGPGQAPFFHCPGCGNNRPMKGRTARRMHGLRTWVCAGCSPKTRPAPPATTRRSDPLTTDPQPVEPNAAANLESRARDLVQVAARLGLVLTIEQVPLQPLAMGNHRTVVSVRPGAGSGSLNPAVDHPRHYNANPSGVECITVVEHMGFNVGNAMKYLWRAGEKGNAVEDLRKAAWYVQREIERFAGADPGIHVAAEPVAPAALNVMLDLETMGNGPQAAIVAIGAVEFDVNAGTVGERFYAPVDLESSVKAGCVMDPATVLWWLRQGDSARSAIAGGGMLLVAALTAFSSWLHKLGGGPAADVQVWGNGAAFDNVILASAYRAEGLPQPWPYWNDRCYRTVKALRGANVPLERVGTHHNAADDAESQARHLVAMLRLPR